MHPADDDDQDNVQVIRLAGSKGKTAHITTHQDTSSGTTIVLWNDVLRVFPDALYLQRGRRVIPFLKGADFEDLRPPRVAAIPGAILDVIVKDELKQDTQGKQQKGTTTTPLEMPPQSKSAITIVATNSASGRNPAYGDEQAALENYSHIDPPRNITVERSAAYKSEGPAVDNNTHVDHSRSAAPRRNPTYGDELAALENYNHIDPPSNFAAGKSATSMPVGRNPTYGDELAALENYNHIDVPNMSARGPQLIPENFTHPSQVSSDKPQEPPSSIKSGSRMPQFHPEKTPTPTLPAKSPQRGNTTAELAQLGGRVKRSGHAPSSNVLKQDDTAKQRGQGLFQIGVRRETGVGAQRDYGLAMDYFVKASEQGHSEAPYNIARMYEYGRGVSQDESKAAEWYIKAGERGHLLSQIKLGSQYAYGEGVPRNPSESFKWRLLAAEQGDMSSQYLVGLQYDSGDGIPQDNLKALEWYLKAAEQGDSSAKYRLGQLYRTGPTGIPQDYPKALDWYLKAAKHGHMGAETEIGTMYELGLGVPKDESKAMEWYDKAGDHYGAAEAWDRRHKLSTTILNRQQQQQQQQEQ